MLTATQLCEFAVAVRQSTINRLKAVPPDRSDWSPDQNALSFCQIARHLFECDYALIDGIKTGKRDACFPDQDKDDKDISEVITDLERSLQDKLALIASLEEKELQRKVTAALHDGDQQVPIWWMILRINLDHEIHHRGQLALYLRLLSD